MTRASTARRLSRWGLLLIFTYGALVHLLMARWCRWWAFRPGSVPGPAVGWLTDLGFATLGGSIFARLMLFFPSRAGSPQARQYGILSAALKGLAATAAALECLYVLEAAALGLWAYSGDPTEGPLHVMILLAFLDVQTFGLQPLVQGALLGSVFGGLAGFLTVKLESNYPGLVREPL